MNPSIELFRGLAAWMVLTMHYAPFITNNIQFLNFFQTGVDLFFVISGFVFAPTVFSGKLQLLPYLSRRFFRIYPLYLTALILYYLFTLADPSKTTYFFNHLFFLQTIHSVAEVNYFNIAFWSLPVEVEFYLLLPLLTWLFAKGRFIPIILFTLFFLFRGWIGFNASGINDPNSYTLLTVHLPGILIEFMIGMFLFRIYEKYRNSNIARRYIVLIIIAALALLFIVSLFFRPDNTLLADNLYIKSYINLFSAAGYALLLFPFLLIIKPSDSLFCKLCLLLGNMSFSVYLLHNLAPLILKRIGLAPGGIESYLLCTLITILLSIACYYIIENPARIFGKHLSRKLLNRTAG